YPSRSSFFAALAGPGLFVPAGVEERLQFEKDDQLVVSLDDARDVLGVDRRDKLRRGVDIGLVDLQHFGDAVDDHAHGLAPQLRDDDPPLIGNFALFHAKTLAQVDHRDHAAPQVDHALNVFGRPG